MLSHTSILNILNVNFKEYLLNYNFFLYIMTNCIHLYNENLLLF